MQKKTSFFFSFGCPNLRGGGSTWLGQKTKFFQWFDLKAPLTKTTWLLKIYKVFCDTKYMSKSPNLTMPGGWWCNVRLISQLCFSVWLWLPSIFLASYLLPHKTSWDVIKTFLRKIKISSKIFSGWWRLLSLNPTRSPASQDLVKYFLQRRWKIFNIEYIELDSLHKRMLNAVIPQIYPRR